MLRIIFLSMIFCNITHSQAYKGEQVGLFPSRSSIELLISYRANLVRYQIHSVGWGAAETASCQDYKNAANQYLDHLDTLLDLNIKYVLDLHVPLGGRISGNDPALENTEYQNCMISWWIDTTYRYKGNSKILAFDLYNEPMGNPAAISAFMTKMYKHIRAIDRARIIIVAGKQHSASQFSNIKYYNDAKVWYSFHFYDPGNFTHNGVFSAFNPKTSFYPRGTLDRDKLEAYLSQVINFRKKYPNAGIYAGEFGAVYTVDPLSRFRWFRDCIQIFKEYNINWTHHAMFEWEGWDYRNDPRILNLFLRNFR